MMHSLRDILALLRSGCGSASVLSSRSLLIAVAGLLANVLPSRSLLIGLPGLVVGGLELAFGAGKDAMVGAVHDQCRNEWKRM